MSGIVNRNNTKWGNMEASKARKHNIDEFIRGNGLDLGCAINKVKPDCIGIDLETYEKRFPEYLKFGNVNLIGDVTNLYWFRDNVFDFVFSSHTLEDIQDTEKTLKEWIRVIKCGGCLILYLPHRDYYPRIGQPHANAGHKHDFCNQDIIDIMSLINKSQMAFYMQIIRDEVYGCDKYDHDKRGEIEYSFLQVWRKL